MRFRRFSSLLIIAVLAALLAACGPPTAETTETETPEAEEPAASEEEATAAPETEAPAAEELEAQGPPAGFEDQDYTTTESGLQYAIVEEGSGEQPEMGDVVRVHYTGMLADGTEFDSSRGGGEPFQFALGRGQVIPGWDEGIGFLHEGGSAKLVIPPELGYGAQGSSGAIPPNATLYFDVELVEILPGGPDSPTAVDEDEYETTDSGIQYYVIEEGDGESPEEGDPVRVHFTFWLEDGTRLNSSIDVGQPLTFVIGQGQVPQGLEEGVADMNVGGYRQLVLPPELAFGEQGAGNTVPPDSTIIFEVELLEIMPSGPDQPEDVDADEYETTENGLQYVDLEEGSGAEVEAGQPVSIHYTGWLTDGAKFDSSFNRGEPFTFVPGTGQMLPGVDEGVIGMMEGGRRQLRIPPDLAYGAQGAGGVIPPNATLIFLIEVIEVGEASN